MVRGGFAHADPPQPLAFSHVYRDPPARVASSASTVLPFHFVHLRFVLHTFGARDTNLAPACVSHFQQGGKVATGIEVPLPFHRDISHLVKWKSTAATAISEPSSLVRRLWYRSCVAAGGMSAGTRGHGFAAKSQARYAIRQHTRDR